MTHYTDDYIKRKLGNQALWEYIDELPISFKSKIRIRECATLLHFVADKNISNHKLYKINGCGHRFCPMCAWRKSRKEGFMLSIASKHITEELGKSLIFLTLTIPNVAGEDLEQSIKDYNTAFKRLMQRKQVAKVVQGYARKLEVTYNLVRDDYHPHFHVIIAVNKSYFSDSKAYIKHATWLKLWQEATRNPLITQVDVRAVKEGNRDNAIAEITKYTAKAEEYLYSEAVFNVFYGALYNKRVTVFSGLFKQAKKLYEDGELDHLKEKKDKVEYEYEVFNSWQGKQRKYKEKQPIPISDEVSENVNN